MQLRNWIELGIAVVILITGLMIKYVTGKKRKKAEGFKGINNDGPGRGWKVR